LPFDAHAQLHLLDQIRRLALLVRENARTNQNAFRRIRVSVDSRPPEQHPAVPFYELREKLRTRSPSSYRPPRQFYLFGVTASVQLFPALIDASCDAPRGQGQRCVRPTYATQHFQIRAPALRGLPVCSTACATPPIDEPRALVAHPASTQWARGNWRFTTPESLRRRARSSWLPFWLRGILSLAMTMRSNL